MNAWQHNDFILVDTHVHYYPFCTYSEYFTAAHTNMSNWAHKLDDTTSFTGILCLLETQNSQSYGELLSIAQTSKAIDDWHIETPDSSDFLFVSDELGREILVVPGTQVITSENIEVLVIGTKDKIPQDRSVLSYIEEFSDSKLVILPWGVGKWLGRRGDIVSSIIDSMSQYRFALGDNSGRPSIWRNVPQFEQALKRGINILAGSDPLPVAGQYKKLGSYGVAIKGSLKASNLVSQLREKLLNPTRSDLINYGKLDNLLEFIQGQLLLRTRRL